MIFSSSSAVVFSGVFFAPEFGGYFLEYNNFIPADPLKTPLHRTGLFRRTTRCCIITSEMMYALIAACVLLGAVLPLC
jgi:ubiquinol-cytochrome c reductase cytochrome b subunit